MSARLIIRVFTLGRSRPASIIVVQTNTFVFCDANVDITSSSFSSGMRPWAIDTIASGTNLFTVLATSVMLCILLWTKYTWPPRSNSRNTASRIKSSLYSET